MHIFDKNVVGELNYACAFPTMYVDEVKEKICLSSAEMFHIYDSDMPCMNTCDIFPGNFLLIQYFVTIATVRR